VRASEIEKPSVADEEQDQDAPDQVMDVPSADHHPFEGAVLVDNEADQQPRADKCNEERDRGQKHATPGPVGNGGSDEEAEPRELEKHQQDNDNKACENQ